MDVVNVNTPAKAQMQGFPGPGPEGQLKFIAHTQDEDGRETRFTASKFHDFSVRRLRQVDGCMGFAGQLQWPEAE